MTEHRPTTLLAALQALASSLSLLLAFLAQNSLDIGTCHVERLESGPVVGQPQFSWDDLVACRATKLPELDGLFAALRVAELAIRAHGVAGATAVMFEDVLRQLVGTHVRHLGFGEYFL